MAVERGNLLQCADRALHHANWTVFMPPLSPQGKLRIESLEDALLKIRNRIARIKEAADAGNVTAIHAILSEDFSFGKSS